MKNNMYLGDGTYCGLDHRGIILYTSDGVDRTNTVVLGPAELKAFLHWLNDLEKKLGEKYL